GVTGTDVTGNLLEQWGRIAEAQQTVDIPVEMTRLALTIASRVFFGAEPASDRDAIARGLPTLQQHITRRMRGYPDVPDWLPIPSHQRFRALQSRIKALGQRLIADRRALSEGPEDFLSILLGANAG